MADAFATLQVSPLRPHNGRNAFVQAHVVPHSNETPKAELRPRPKRRSQGELPESMFFAQTQQDTNVAPVKVRNPVTALMTKGQPLLSPLTSVARALRRQERAIFDGQSQFASASTGTEVRNQETQPGAKATTSMPDAVRRRWSDPDLPSYLQRKDDWAKSVQPRVRRTQSATTASDAHLFWASLSDHPFVDAAVPPGLNPSGVEAASIFAVPEQQTDTYVVPPCPTVPEPGATAPPLPKHTPNKILDQMKIVSRARRQQDSAKKQVRAYKKFASNGSRLSNINEEREDEAESGCCDGSSSNDESAPLAEVWSESTTPSVSRDLSPEMPFAGNADPQEAASKDTPHEFGEAVGEPKGNSISSMGTGNATSCGDTPHAVTNQTCKDRLRDEASDRAGSLVINDMGVVVRCASPTNRRK